MYHKHVCQSCGMAMDNGWDFGTNSDGTRSREFCTNCFRNGGFTHPEMTLDDAIREATTHIWLSQKITRDNAMEIAENTLPRLKRWHS